MLSVDVGQFLQMILICQIGTKPFDRFIITTLRQNAALTIVAGNTVQLSYQRFVNALIFSFS